MHRRIHLSILVRFILTALIVLGILLSLPGCSSKRETKERGSDDTSDAEDAESARDGGEETTDESGENNGKDDNDEEDGQSDGTASRDAGDDEEGRDRQDPERAADSGNPEDDPNNDRPDGSDTETEDDEPRPPVIDIRYEDLQEIPNTSARPCNFGGYSPSNPMAFASCEEICPNASCVPNMFLGFVGAPEGLENLFFPCDAESSCIPDHLIGTMGAIQNKKCRSIGNMEGACISVCNTNTASSLSAEYLPQDNCHETEVCVPCYDPIRGGLTAFNPCGNYISSSCNGGAIESGIVFEKCCDGNGTCIPGLTDVNPDISKLLGKDSCQGEDDLCLPRLFGIANYRPARCETDEGDEGRCLSECISPTMAQQFSRRDCAINELCVPCAIEGNSTGACTINDDEPGTSGDL